MNVLELCLSSGLGGLELYVFRSAEALGAHHNVLAVLNNTGKLTDHFKSHSDIKTTYLDYSPGYLPVFNAHRLAKIIDANDIDVIHMHWGNDLALAALAKKMSHRKPGLVYTRQMQITRSKDDFYHRFLYRQMNLMLTITRQLENDARGFINRFADRITTLYYGVGEPEHVLEAAERSTQRQELGFVDDDFVIGLLGRLEQGKGQHLLIEALSLASKDGIAPKALIVGHEMNPGYRNTLQKLAESMDVANNIVFMDFVTDPQRLIQLCDCIALTSYEETFGLVLPEAMRAGVAVIGSSKGGVPEIIDDRQNGLLFETKNPESLYQAIHTLYMDPKLKKNLVAKGKIKADIIFNESMHFNILEQHLQDAISRHLAE